MLGSVACGSPAWRCNGWSPPLVLLHQLLCRHACDPHTTHSSAAHASLHAHIISFDTPGPEQLVALFACRPHDLSELMQGLLVAAISCAQAAAVRPRTHDCQSSEHGWGFWQHLEKLLGRVYDGSWPHYEACVTLGQACVGMAVVGVEAAAGLALAAVTINLCTAWRF